MKATEYLEKKIEQLKSDADVIVSDVKGRELVTPSLIVHSGEKLAAIQIQIEVLEMAYYNATGTLPQLRITKNNIHEVES